MIDTKLYVIVVGNGKNDDCLGWEKQALSNQNIVYKTGKCWYSPFRNEPPSFFLLNV